MGSGIDMNDVKVGDRLTIHCYKHNGKIDRVSDEAIVLDVTDEILICANDRTKLTESDGRSHRTKETAILFFYRHNWFNIIGQLKKQGLFFYCNIASPFIIEDNAIKYIDYDLDLRVFPDGGFRVLDRNEYNYHKKIMNYSSDLDLIIKSELSKLIEKKKRNEFPFSKEVVVNYYNQYLQLNKKNG